MAEEFQESEVIFIESGLTGAEFEDAGNTDSGESRKRKKKSKSNPVSIPANFSGNSWLPVLFEGDDCEENGEMTPPHVVVGRRVAGRMAYSVCSGNGRTLKGRDLSEVRNLILRMTGFLET